MISAHPESLLRARPSQTISTIYAPTLRPAQTLRLPGTLATMAPLTLTRVLPPPTGETRTADGPPPRDGVPPRRPRLPSLPTGGTAGGTPRCSRGAAGSRPNRRTTARPGGNDRAEGGDPPAPTDGPGEIPAGAAGHPRSRTPKTLLRPDKTAGPPPKLRSMATTWPERQTTAAVSPGPGGMTGAPPERHAMAPTPPDSSVTARTASEDHKTVASLDLGKIAEVLPGRRMTVPIPPVPCRVAASPVPCRVVAASPSPRRMVAASLEAREAVTGLLGPGLMTSVLAELGAVAGALPGRGVVMGVLADPGGMAGASLGPSVMVGARRVMGALPDPGGEVEGLAALG